MKIKVSIKADQVRVEEVCVVLRVWNGGSELSEPEVRPDCGP